MTITSREALLGTLVMPNKDPQLAYVRRTELGERLVKSLLDTPSLYPEVWVMSWSVMPDHIHIILHVKREMSVGIRTVVRSFWQAARRLGREYSMSVELERIQHKQSEEYAYDPLF